MTHDEENERDLKQWRADMAIWRAKPEGAPPLPPNRWGPPRGGGCIVAIAIAVAHMACTVGALVYAIQGG